MILNTGLKKSIGMPFVFKTKLKEFLLETINSEMTTNALSPSEEIEANKYIQNFIKCTPAMGYSSKLYVYQALEVIINGFLSSTSGVAEDLKTQLSRNLLKCLKFVGAEGDTDFNFQVAVYNTAEVISRITGDVVESALNFVLGTATKIRVFEGGNYFSAPNVPATISESLEFSSLEVDDSEVGVVEVDFVSGGRIEEKEYIVESGGANYYVGQIVAFADSGATYDTYALGEVVEIA